MLALPDIDLLVDVAVTGAEVESGIPLAIVASRSENGAGSKAIWRKASKRHPAYAPLGRWSEDEAAFVRENLGRLSLEEMAAALGRSKNAIKIKFTREGWPAPSKQPDEICAHDLGLVMAKCGKSIAALMERGLMPHRLLAGPRHIRAIKVRQFERWLIDPMNWCYFDWRRIRDGRLRRLCELKAERWDDAWLTTGQAARLMEWASSNSIEERIKRGKLPAVHWANWHVLRSSLEGLHIHPGKGSPGVSKLGVSPRADAFIRRAREQGIEYEVMVRMMGGRYSVKQLGYRWHRLQQGSA